MQLRHTRRKHVINYVWLKVTGIMNSPIFSLDRTHLHSEWKGTIYIATVKSLLNKIIPTAFALMADNKNV
jgi:hypothetical protein